MKPKRMNVVVASAVVLLSVAASTTVSHADDDVPAPTPSTVEAPAPKPTVSITVEDVPDSTEAPKPEPKKTVEPTTDEPTTDAVTTTTVPKADDTKDDAPAPTSGTTTTTTTDPDAPTPTLAASTEVSVGPSSTTSTINPNQNHSDQETQVGGTLVADANTGGNLTNNDAATGSSVPANSIDTGGANAVGSDDTNKVVQGADVVLTDQAIANILQVALILNIGAALANSGANGIAAGPGTGTGGAIGTGDATATGLDMSQYITQAAKAQGDENTDDAATQLAVSLWMGIGLANTGVNAIDGTGGTGSGGTVDSGDSTAIGNHSLTDILQGAAVNGSGTSQTNIEQYATVMNLGFALANSGANDIAGVASNLLTAGDSQEQNDMAVDLFSMLLPALMSTYATSTGSGSIDTGNATAVGNDSQTYVKQLAMAANSGDGIASIIQSVLVANAGAAGANTGANLLGGSYASLDPTQAKAVVTLAAFLAQMLALVHYQATDQQQVAQEQGLDIPFGDIVLQVRGAMQGVDTTLNNDSGAKANVRQVTIILSLGWAQANSGLNAAIAANGDPGAVGLMSSNDLAAGVNNGTLDQIRTANADGINQGLVIICQRRNADDIACLAPPPDPADDPADDPSDPSTPPTTVDPNLEQFPTIVSGPPAFNPPSFVGVGGSDPVDPAQQPVTPSGFLLPTATSASGVNTHTGGLPATGSDADSMMQVASWFVGAGAFAFVITRRRRRRT